MNTLKLKKTIGLALCLTVLLVAGCGEDEILQGKVVSETEVGIVVSANEVSKNWNDSQRRTRVETTDGIFIVSGLVSVLKDSAAKVSTFDDGKDYLCIEGRKTCPMIYDN